MLVSIPTLAAVMLLGILAIGWHSSETTSRLSISEAVAVAKYEVANVQRELEEGLFVARTMLRRLMA